MHTGCLMDKREHTIAYVYLVAVAVNAMILTDEGIKLLIAPSREKSTLNSSPLYSSRELGDNKTHYV